MTKVNKLMTEVASIKAKLAKALLGKVEMNAVKTDKAVLVYDGRECGGSQVFIPEAFDNLLLVICTLCHYCRVSIV